MINEAGDIWKLKGDWNVRLYNPYIKESWIDDLGYMLKSTPISNFGIRQDFEKQLAEYSGCKYAVAVNSGTSAILIGLLAMGLKRGDTVIGPNYGQIAWANACYFLGINIVALDVRPDNFCLDDGVLDEYLTLHPEEIQGVCYINQAGYTGPQLEDTVSICKKHNVILFEDSCNAIGQQYNNKQSGTFGDIGFISFGVPKLLTSGEGGAILIKDEETYKLCDDIAYQGGWYASPMHSRLGLGVNFVMPAHNAYFLSRQLKDIDELLAMRKKVSNMYTAGNINIQRHHQPASIYEYYSKNPQKVLNIGYNLKTQFLLGSYITFGHLFNKNPIKTPVSDDLAKHILTLPASLDLDQHSVDLVLASIKMGER